MKNNINKSKNFDELLNSKYGIKGTVKREEFEKKARNFIVSELLKESRLKANLTQTELARKIGTKKSYISRIENGRSDIQLSTLYKLFEQGLGMKVQIKILNSNP